jgi:psiF repeat-containing protein
MESLAALIVAMLAAMPGGSHFHPPHAPQSALEKAHEKAASETVAVPQARVKECEEKAGEEHPFVKACVKRQHLARLLAQQQGRMKTCNKEANDKNLTGLERVDFVRSCMRY